MVSITPVFVPRARADGCGSINTSCRSGRCAAVSPHCAGQARRRKSPSMCGHAWVPADDVTTTVFNFIYSADPQIAMSYEFAMENETEDGRGPEQLLPDGRLKANLYNDYLIDRERQKTGNFLGIEGTNKQ